MEKVLLDSKYVDIAIDGGSIEVRLPVVDLLRELAKRSDNKLDDALVELVAKALGAPEAPSEPVAAE